MEQRDIIRMLNYPDKPMVDFFASMAEAFLDDKDAVKDKMAAYYSHVVK